jgi:hypothetical protein
MIVPYHAIRSNQIADRSVRQTGADGKQRTKEEVPHDAGIK